MQKEKRFRFRFWNGKRLEHNPRIYWDAKNLDECFEAESESNKIMQFTGLLDKNKREIYEGDIVLFVYGQPEIQKDIVDFTPGKFRLKKSYLGIDSFNEIYLLSSNYIQVIGNIYENPDLIDS